ncbi:MAG: hypothetical protein EOM35_02400 [Negativicutes bacterium]|nr:hypothetical protein [Negativicutes bacterium]
MATVKKAYQDIVNLLEANPDVKVSKILPQVIELAEAKNGAGAGTAFMKDAKGNVVAVLDYYFKRWMPVVGSKAVDFGAKAKTATGLNSMCKEGVSHWTKQQREAKNANAMLLTKVASGEVKPADIAKEQEKIEAARKAIVKTDLGFATQDELLAYLKKEGFTVA